MRAGSVVVATHFAFKDPNTYFEAMYPTRPSVRHNSYDGGGIVMPLTDLLRTLKYGAYVASSLV